MSIFTVEQREKVKERLLEVGIELIKEKGIRQMTISEVTKRTGIGKGTFYHFYKAKEWYVYDVIEYSKDGIKNALNAALKQEEGLNRKTLKAILHQYSFYGGNNIVNYITLEDEVWLMERLPKEYTLNIPKEEEIVASLLRNLKGVKGTPNPHVLANMMKIMALAAEHRAILHQDALAENIQLMEQQLLEYLFGREVKEKEVTL